MLCYDYYLTVYGGGMSEDEFQRQQAKALAYLRSITMGRCDLPDLPDRIKNAVKMVLCELADSFHKNDNGGDIVSESNDGISVTYAGKPTQTDEQRLAALVRSRLAWTGLLYRGCC